MVTVYRIEKRKRGPYRIKSLRYKLEPLLDAHNYSYDHPSIYYDLKDSNFDNLSNEIQKKHVCGFRTLEQLYEWFDGFLDLLFECGFKIKEYLVSESDIQDTYSGKQIFFLR